MDKQNSRSYRVQIEKLEGGYISDVTGKRKVHKDAHDIERNIDLSSSIEKFDEGEYILSIDLVPIELFDSNILGDEITMILPITPNKEKELSLREQAIKDGIIEAADKFDPKTVKPDTTNEPIHVTAINAYTIAELTSFDWEGCNKKVPLSKSEMAQITGLKDAYVHNLWPKIISKSFQWNSLDTRIKMTILAQYYEKKLAKRAKIESLPPRNDKRLMEVVTEIELLCKSSMVKSNVLLKKIDQFKKLLIQD